MYGIYVHLPKSVILSPSGNFKKRKIFLIQDPVFFYEREDKLKFHKQKILLHFLSLNEYAKELKNKGYTVYNISIENLYNRKEYKSIIMKNNITKLHICDVVDSYLFNKINNNCKKLSVKIQWYDSPRGDQGNGKMTFLSLWGLSCIFPNPNL